MKTCQEWSLAFDQLWNNINSNKAPGIDEYEKSFFLTDAQETIVIGIYNGTFGKAFESTEDVANFLAPLVRQVNMLRVSDTDVLNYQRVDRTNGVLYQLPAEADEILFRTLELCTLESACDENGSPAVVVPVTQDEYWRTIRDPFKTYNSNRVLRLIFSRSAEDNTGELHTNKYTELISKATILTYSLRYIARPKPIIVADDLAERGLTIHGEDAQQTCLLDEAIHQAILNEAVRMAKAVWQN